MRSQVADAQYEADAPTRYQDASGKLLRATASRVIPESMSKCRRVSFLERT